MVCFNKLKEKEKFTLPIFDNKVLSSSQTSQIESKYCVFPTKHDDICEYNPQSFITIGLILDKIIMYYLTDITKQQNKSVIYPEIKVDKIYLY